MSIEINPHMSTLVTSQSTQPRTRIQRFYNIVVYGLLGAAAVTFLTTCKWTPDLSRAKQDVAPHRQEAPALQPALPKPESAVPLAKEKTEAKGVKPGEPPTDAKK